MPAVLVVDDRPEMRYIMTRSLAAAGFQVHESATGQDAMRLANPQVDAIVLDLVLPDMDGFDVLRRLKANPATSNIPVILKTGMRVEDGYRQRGLQAGAAAYVTEPFEPRALVAAVRGVLGDSASSGSPSKP
jgi:DNA-binding response OmpR family regulator